MTVRSTYILLKQEHPPTSSPQPQIKRSKSMVDVKTLQDHPSEPKSKAKWKGKGKADPGKFPKETSAKETKKPPSSSKQMGTPKPKGAVKQGKGSKGGPKGEAKKPQDSKDGAEQVGDYCISLDIVLTVCSPSRTQQKLREIRKMDLFQICPVYQARYQTRATQKNHRSHKCERMLIIR